METQQSKPPETGTETEIETIVRAAIKSPSGVIVTGSRHFSIGHAMLKSGLCSAPFPGGEAQGFLTSLGRFVDRATARDIAIRAGQVPVDYPKKHLFSEDLWPASDVEKFNP